jgi:hypothetical protein
MKKYEDGSSLTKHITDLDHRKILANHAGANITDEAYKIIIIQSLPPSWNNVAMPLYDMPTAAEVITRLECYELHLSTQREALLQNSNSTTAYMTSSSPHVNGPPPTRPTCLLCTNPIHGLQGRVGHTMTTCFSPGGGMAGQWPPHLLKNGPRRPVIPTPATANTSIAPIPELQSHDNSIAADTAFVASLSQTTDDDYQTMFFKLSWLRTTNQTYSKHILTLVHRTTTSLTRASLMNTQKSCLQLDMLHHRVLPSQLLELAISKPYA